MPKLNKQKSHKKGFKDEPVTEVKEELTPSPGIQIEGGVTPEVQSTTMQTPAPTEIPMDPEGTAPPIEEPETSLMSRPGYLLCADGQYRPVTWFSKASGFLHPDWNEERTEDHVQISAATYLEIVEALQQGFLVDVVNSEIVIKDPKDAQQSTPIVEPSEEEQLASKIRALFNIVLMKMSSLSVRHPSKYSKSEIELFDLQVAAAHEYRATDTVTEVFKVLLPRASPDAYSDLAKSILAKHASYTNVVLRVGATVRSIRKEIESYPPPPKDGQPWEGPDLSTVQTWHDRLVDIQKIVDKYHE